MGTLAKENTIVKRLARPIKPAPLLPGARSDTSGKAVTNVILLSLPDEEYSMLRPHLEPAELPQDAILHEPGEKIAFAYFLHQGMNSRVALGESVRSVGVGIVGKEGMVGMSPPPSPVRRELPGSGRRASLPCRMS